MNPQYPQQQQYPPPPQQYTTQAPRQYYSPPPQPKQYQYYNDNPSYAELGEQQYLNNTGGNAKIQPSSGFKDVWATVLWLCNMAAFIALSVIGLRSFSSSNKAPSSSPGGGSGSGVTFDLDTVKIFGLSGIVGFGLSFIYLIVANL